MLEVIGSRRRFLPHRHLLLLLLFFTSHCQLIPADSVVVVRLLFLFLCKNYQHCRRQSREKSRLTTVLTICCTVSFSFSGDDCLTLKLRFSQSVIQSVKLRYHFFGCNTSLFCRFCRLVQLTRHNLFSSTFCQSSYIIGD